MYVPIIAWPSRNDEKAKTPTELLEHALDGLFGTHPYVQMGGNETVGMGWFSVAIAKSADA